MEKQNQAMRKNDKLAYISKNDDQRRPMLTYRHRPAIIKISLANQFLKILAKYHCRMNLSEENELSNCALLNSQFSKMWKLFIGTLSTNQKLLLRIIPIKEIRVPRNEKVCETGQELIISTLHSVLGGRG